jgi:hypothetical protein
LHFLPRKSISILFSAFTLVGIPILIPLNVVNGLDSNPPPDQKIVVKKEDLTKLAIGNVAQSWRLWFHLVLTVVFAGKFPGLAFLKKMYTEQQLGKNGMDRGVIPLSQGSFWPIPPNSFILSLHT